MLSENEAIERMHDLIHTCEVGMKKNSQYDDLFEKDKQAIETVLNIIDRLRKENKDIQNRKEHQELRFKKYKEDIKKQHEEIYEELVSEKEEKDKQIDLMAEYIYNMQIECNVYYKDKKQVKQYFENKAREDNINE